MPQSQKGNHLLLVVGSIPLSGFVPKPLSPDCQLSFPNIFVFSIPQPLKFMQQTFIFLLTCEDLGKHLFSLSVLSRKGSVFIHRITVYIRLFL